MVGQPLLPIEHLRANDETLTKLKLMESVQGNRDWLATVSAVTPEERSMLGNIKTELEKGSYSAYMDRDFQGNDALRIRHIGHRSSIEEAAHKLGVGGGLQNAMDKVQSSVNGAVHIASTTIDKPIKFLTLNYLLADLSMMASGFYSGGVGDDNKEVSTAGKVAAATKSFSGVMSMLQSFIFMKYGQDANVRQLNTLTKDINQAVAQGDDPYALLLRDADVKTTHNIVDSLEKYLRDNPVKAGARVWQFGQLALAAGGGLQLWESRNDTEKKGIENIVRAMISCAGWEMLSTEAKHTEQKTAFEDNPIRRISEEFYETPERYAGLVATSASLVGLRASMKDADPFQGLNEILCLTGDTAMFLTKADEYGAGSDGNPVAAAEAATKFMQEAPMIFTQTKETQFVHDLSHYMAERSVNEKLDYRGEPINGDDTPRLEAINDLTHNMASAIFAKLSGTEKRIDKVANSIARLSESFPTQHRDALESRLSHAVAGMHGVYADEQELLALVKQEHTRFAKDETPMSPPSMSMISDVLAELTLNIPPMDAGHNAALLYDITSEFTRTSPMQEQIFEQSLANENARQLGITPQMAKEYMSQQEEALVR